MSSSTILFQKQTKDDFAIVLYSKNDWIWQFHMIHPDEIFIECWPACLALSPDFGLRCHMKLDVAVHAYNSSTWETVIFMRPPPPPKKKVLLT